MKVGIIQLCSNIDYQVNIAKIKTFLRDAKSLGVKAVFLPECFYSLSNGIEISPYLVQNGNEHYRNIQNLAKEFEIYLLSGSAATTSDSGIVNRSYNFDPDGQDLGFYDKMHLFACDLEGARQINESDIYASGNEPSLIKAGPLNIGQSICFDIRYPDMYRQYVLDGANVLSIPAAFTIPTGIAHWHILVRARAIENQCFVIAPAQWGNNNERISTYGHSLIVDPWGEVLVDAGEGEKLVVATLELSKMHKVRRKVKVF